MSELAKLIKAEPTGKRFSDTGIIHSMVTQDSYCTKVPYGIEYTIGVKFGAKVVVTDQSVSAGGLSKAVERVQRSVASAVFGEFREPINRIRVALWERDIRKAEDLLDLLERQMFTDG